MDTDEKDTEEEAATPADNAENPEGKNVPEDGPTANADETSASEDHEAVTQIQIQDPGADSGIASTDIGAAIALIVAIVVAIQQFYAKVRKRRDDSACRTTHVDSGVSRS